MPGYDSKEGMKSGNSEQTDRVARGAGQMLEKGAEVHPGGVTKNNPPAGNPDAPGFSNTRKIGGS